LIDTLKEVVPIWKRETWIDGTEQWVHPGMCEATEKSPENTCKSADGHGENAQAADGHGESVRAADGHGENAKLATDGHG
jgi:hypothetical protein